MREATCPRKGKARAHTLPNLEETMRDSLAKGRKACGRARDRRIVATEAYASWIARHQKPYGGPWSAQARNRQKGARGGVRRFGTERPRASRYRFCGPWNLLVTNLKSSEFPKSGQLVPQILHLFL